MTKDGVYFLLFIEVKDEYSSKRKVHTMCFLDVNFRNFTLHLVILVQEEIVLEIQFFYLFTADWVSFSHC